MKIAPLPDDEHDRLERLHDLQMLDTPFEASFDRLVKLAQRLFEVPMVAISLVDRHRQWFKACAGLTVRETSRDVAFCAHAILSPEVMFVPNTHEDMRFFDNPLVLGGPQIRAYMAAPLLASPKKSAIGTLCLLDTRPRFFSDSDQHLLQELAAIAERELRMKQLESVWSHSPLSMLLLDEEGRLRLANKAAERLCGAELQEFLHLAFELMLQPVDREIFRDMLSFTLRTRTSPIRRELRLIRPTGELIPIGVSFAALPDYPNMCVCVIRDISLERNTRPYEGVLSAVKDELQLPLTELRVLLTKLEYRDSAADAEILHEQAILALNSAEERMVARLSDVAGRLQTEAALRESEQRFRQVVEQVSDPMLTLNEDGIIVGVNNRALKVLGYERDTMTEKHINNLVREGQIKDALILPPKESTLDCSLVCADERYIEVELHLLPLDWQGPPRWIVLIKDITEHKRSAALIREENALLERRVLERTQALAQAAETAQVAVRAKSVFLANMSHELRTPLNVILGMTKRTLMLNLESDARRYINNIDEAARGLLELLTNILDISRNEVGRLTLNPTNFSLQELVRGVVRMLNHQAEEKQLQLKVAIDPNLPLRVSGDAVRLTQILRNLLHNAIKFTERGGVMLTISGDGFTSSGVICLIMVTDTGIGISAEALARLSQPFVQADDSITRRYGGTGLGLAITRQLLELMHGSLELTSAPGMGTTARVRLTFELAQAQLETLEDRTLHIRSPRERFEGFHVLLVEDQPLNAEIAEALLSDLGLRVTLARNGLEALCAVRDTAIPEPGKAPFDAILMDLQMPEMDGLTCTRLIRGLSDPARAQLPILAMTAHAMEADREKSLLAGMNDHLTKPIEEPLLVSALNRWLPSTRPQKPAPEEGSVSQPPSTAVAGAPTAPDSTQPPSTAVAGAPTAPDSTPKHGRTSGQREASAPSTGELETFEAETASQAAQLLPVKVDLLGVLRRLRGNMDRLRSLLTRFVPQSSAELAQLLLWSSHGDHVQVQQSLHSLKGASLNLGLTSFGGLAETLEQQVRQGCCPSSHEIQVLRQHLASTRDYLITEGLLETS
ncbi:MAG: PAS domain S-box protein [Myxococcota bacterium]